MSGTVGDARKRLAESVSAANEVKLTEAGIVSVLAEHTYEITHRPLSLCVCGWYGKPDVEAGETLQEVHRAHVAAILGARLSAREPDDGGFWDRLGVDDGLMPVHLPMGVNEAGEGPENDSDAHHFVCWCGDQNCPLTKALNLAAAVPVSGVPTEAVREPAAAEALLDEFSDYCDAADIEPFGKEAFAEWLVETYQVTPLVQRAAETNESGTP